MLAPDAPGHGESAALPLESYRPSIVAGVAADLLSALGISRAIFVGFSWGARIACAFGAAFPELAAGLLLIDGGYLEWADIPGIDTGADLSSCVAHARRRAESDFFESWDVYLAVQREELGRWSPELAEAHRAMMREVDGKIHPILQPEIGRRDQARRVPGAASRDVSAHRRCGNARAPGHGSRRGRVPTSGRCGDRPFPVCPSRARVQSRPDAIHDLVSSAPADMAELIGVFATQPPP